MSERPDVSMDRASVEELVARVPTVIGTWIDDDGALSPFIARPHLADDQLTLEFAAEQGLPRAGAQCCCIAEESTDYSSIKAAVLRGEVVSGADRPDASVTVRVLGITSFDFAKAT